MSCTGYGARSQIEIRAVIHAYICDRGHTIRIAWSLAKMVCVEIITSRYRFLCRLGANLQYASGKSTSYVCGTALALNVSRPKVVTGVKQ